MLTADTTVAQAVLDHSELARIFQQLRIDFCCRGQATIAQACEHRGLALGEVLSRLTQAVDNGSDESADVRALSNAALVAHLVTDYHEPLRARLPFLSQLADKVGRVHGEAEPRLKGVARFVHELAESLLPHLDQEEREAFPPIMSGDWARAEDATRGMKAEHEEIGRLLEKIRSLAAEFVIPESACMSYRTLFTELEKLEAEIHRHVHIENNVMLPRIAAMTHG